MRPCIAQDDAPPALDQETLLRLLQGFKGHGNQPAPRETLPEAPRAHESRRDRSAEAEHATQRPGAAGDSHRRPTSRRTKSRRGVIGILRSSASRFLPLPARFDLDDEMREAFLADASDLFERIERIVIGLRSLD